MAVDPTTVGLGAVAAAVLGWFVVGTELNLRRGRHLLRWLEEGLPLLGPRTTLRWLGSSAIELRVQEALGPLRRAELFIVLEPRDLPVILWWFRHRGRRDLLIVRGELRDPPRGEFEVIDPRAWSTRNVPAALQRRGWTAVSMRPDSHWVGYGPGGSAVGMEVVEIAALPEVVLVRLASHRQAPHIEVQWRLDALHQLKATTVLDAFQKVAGRV